MTDPLWFSKSRYLHPKMEKKNQYLMDQGICCPSKGFSYPRGTKNWCSYRVCDDYRTLNSVTLPDQYPVPHIHNLTNILHSKDIVSKLYIVRAHFHILIFKEDIEKTVVTAQFGSFKFLYWSFGLKCAVSTFQKFVNQVLANLHFAISYVTAYLK